MVKSCSREIFCQSLSCGLLPKAESRSREVGEALRTLQ